MSEPTSVTTRPISAEDRKALAEQEAIKLGVADVTFAWSSIENALVDVLFRILYGITMGMVSTIYFTPAALENRQRLVDNSLRSFLKEQSVGAVLLEEWGQILNTLTRLRKTRNKIAHSEMIISSWKGRPVVRLIGPLMKLDQYAPMFADALRQGRKPNFGLGSNELRNAGDAADRASRRIKRFASYLDLLRAGDDATLLRKLAEAKAETPNPPPPDSQTPPEP